jgi:hypothetical protein
MALAQDWRERGAISPAQASRLEEIDSGRLFSVHREIRAMLYIGVAALIAGVAMTVKKHFNQLGEPAIVAALLTAIAASWGYCGRRVAPFSRDKAASPTAAFDYLLYLGCALLGVLFGYLESQHHFLKEYWDFYLLLSGLAFFGLAYRFDNRFVLALALINAAGWWGVRFSVWSVPGLDWKARAIVFGVGSIAAGVYTGSVDLKSHFEDTYFTAGIHPVYWALLPGAFDHGFAGVSLYLVLALSAGVIELSRRRRRFSFFAYGLGYGYLAASAATLKLLSLRSGPGVALFFLVSGLAVIAALLAARRHFEQDNS